MFFSVDFSVSSKPSLHVVFTSYNMYNALSKRGKRYNYQKMKICVLLSRPSDTQFGRMVPSLAHLKIILYPPKSFIYSIPLVPDHLNKRTTSRLGPLLSSPKVFPIDVMLKRYNYQKMKICVLLSRPSDTQFGHMVPSLAHLKIILYPPKSFIYSIPLVPDHLNKRTTPAFRDSDHFFLHKTSLEPR